MILFDLLLRLFPRAFRDAFGDDMRALFTDQRRAARANGMRAQLLLWMRTAAGMTAAAWRERRDGRRVVPRRLALFETLATDLSLTIRMLFARPLFAAIVIAALSIGVGGVATIFSGLNALVLRPLPGVTGGDDLVLN
jgi:putative ABC transport system permease protein